MRKKKGMLGPLVLTIHVMTLSFDPSTSHCLGLLLYTSDRNIEALHAHALYSHRLSASLCNRRLVLGHTCIHPGALIYQCNLRWGELLSWTLVGKYI